MTALPFRSCGGKVGETMKVAPRLRGLYETSPALIRNVGGTIAGSLPPNLRYGREFAAMSRRASALDVTSAVEVNVLLLSEVQRVWNTAVQRVPHYRGLVAKGEAPREIKHLKDLENIPLLTKENVRSVGALLYDPAQAPGSYREVTTGGTSGKPLALRVTHDASAREWALMLDSWSRVGFRSRSRRAVLRGARIRGREHGVRIERDPANRALLLSGFDVSPQDLASYVEAIRRYRADFLHAYPSTAWILAKHLALSGDARSLELRAVLLGSETIYPDQRALIEDVFGCRVYSWYGHTEKCAFASECETEHAYHPHPLYGFVELVDESGTPVTQPGKRGRIVATGFLNAATILVRYVTDDEAEWTDEPCSCGRPGWRLKNVAGHRTQEYLVSSAGTLIPMTFLHGIHSEAFAAVSEFQFYQDTPALVEYRYIPGPAWSEQRLMDIQRELTLRLHGQVQVRTVEVSAIPRTESGKYRFVDQRLAGYGEDGLHFSRGCPE